MMFCENIDEREEFFEASLAMLSQISDAKNKRISRAIRRNTTKLLKLLSRPLA